MFNMTPEEAARLGGADPYGLSRGMGAPGFGPQGPLTGSDLNSPGNVAAREEALRRFYAQQDVRGQVGGRVDTALGDTQAAIDAAIRQARGDFQDDFDYEQQLGETQFDRQRRDIAEDFNDRLSIADANIGREKKGLANANYAYREFMDRINPGFSEAVEAAERGAKATAAIEATFDENQEAIDGSYASAGGRVRAIADVVGAGGNGEVAAALHETVYEMKDFIDQQNGLNRQQTLAMHAVAANLAAAAAQQGLAQAEGEGSRSIYETQGQYEKIINNLIQQRDYLNNQKQRALRAIDESQADWDAGRQRELNERMEQYDDIDVTAFQANADWDSYGGMAMSIFFEEIGQNEDTAIPKTERDFVQEQIQLMADGGYSFDQYLEKLGGDIAAAEAQGVEAGLIKQAVSEFEALQRYQDQIEIGVQVYNDSKAKYNQIHAGSPTTPADMAVAEFERLRQFNLPEDVIKLLTGAKLGVNFPNQY